MADPDSLHATLVMCDGGGVLLVGPSGSGKSDLALRMMQRGAQLVADDRVECRATPLGVMARAPEAGRGWIELRGVGLLKVPYCGEAVVRVVVALVARKAVERLPKPEHYDLCDQSLPLFRLHAFDAATPEKVMLLPSAVRDGRLMPQDQLLARRESPPHKELSALFQVA